MTRLPIYQVDAFTDRLFAGNPAAVIPLTEWLPEATLQSIAAENNLPATAFFRRDGDGAAIRWFTAVAELPLCGHGTLASAFVILTRLDPSLERIDFRAQSGAVLRVVRAGEAFAMTLSADPARPCPAPAGLAEALGAMPRETLVAQRTLAVFDDAATIPSLAPDFAALRKLDRGVIVTAPGNGGFDCVSRVLAPAPGLDEDPVTGSAHCTLIPYWAARLGKTRLRARQASPRGGTLDCTLDGDRVTLAGSATLYMEGTITV
jgi:PhzF family phenazine biosynthesis protein